MGKLSDELRWLFWTRCVSVNLMCDIRDRRFAKANEHRWIRRLLFPPRMRPGYDFYNFDMNDDMAQFIKFHSGRCSYRGLSGLFKDRHPETNVIHEDQKDGEYLRHYAAAYLEDPSIEG